MKEEPQTTNMGVVNVKTPPFWPANPQVWFAQVEVQFTTRGISQQCTKYDYIIASLAPEHATEIHELLLQPQTETPYDVLKRQLIQHTIASEKHQLQQLFSTKELGTRKQTQLL